MIGQDEIERAVAIAQEAGRLVLTYLEGDRMEAREKGEKDVVTAADTASEALIKRRLQDRFPGDGLVAEEGTNEPAATGRQWYIDPVDGTVNFAHRMPVWCVSMSLFEHDRPVLGVIHDPLRNETFTSARGSGAFLNGTRVTASDVADMGQAFVHHTIDFHHGTLQTGLKDIHILAPRVYRTRNIGSAALALAYVACGRFDAMVHRHAHTWDYGAGVLLVEEAGGVVTQFDGSPFSTGTTGLVAAATGTLQAEIRSVIRDLSPTGLE